MKEKVMFHIEEFLAYLEKSRYSQSTRKSYFYLLSHFQRHCVENGISDVRGIVAGGVPTLVLLGTGHIVNAHA